MKIAHMGIYEFKVGKIQGFIDSSGKHTELWLTRKSDGNFGVALLDIDDGPLVGNRRFMTPGEILNKTKETGLHQKIYQIIREAT